MPDHYYYYYYYWASLVQFSNCKFFPCNPTAHNWLTLQSLLLLLLLAVVGWGRREAKGGVSKTHILRFVATARTCCFSCDQVSAEEEEEEEPDGLLFDSWVVHVGV